MRALAIALAVAAALLGGSYYFFFVAGGPARAPEPAQTLVVVAATAGVQIAGPDGRVRPARSGDALSPLERVRTDDAAEATLRASDGSTVKMLGGSEAKVAELGRQLQRLELDVGMVEADVRDDPTRVFEVRLEAEREGGVVRTRGASFVASAGPTGGAVASRRGEVILSARGKEVVIRTGQYARLRPGQPPDEPAPLPPSLFLKVAWPKGPSTSRKVVVAGETAPGARVQVAGRHVPVGVDGRYRAELDLPDGEHRVTVRARDVAGHLTDETSPRIVVDTQTDFEVARPKWK